MTHYDEQDSLEFIILGFLSRKLGIFLDLAVFNPGIFLPGDKGFLKFGNFYPGDLGFFKIWGFLSQRLEILENLRICIFAKSPVLLCGELGIF